MGEYKNANETMAMFMDDKDALADRKLFVENLGKLYTQTREQVLNMKLDTSENVIITYKGGSTKKVNVHLDSYAAIIRDVSKCV